MLKTVEPERGPQINPRQDRGNHEAKDKKGLTARQSLEQKGRIIKLKGE